MYSEYGTEVYKALKKVIKISFSSHLGNSGIVFERFYRLSDLVTGKEHYQLMLEGGDKITFVSKDDFINHFSRYLMENIKNYTKEYNDLINHRSDEYTDEVAIENRYKIVNFFKHQQLKILQELKDLKNEMNSQLSK